MSKTAHELATLLIETIDARINERTAQCLGPKQHSESSSSFVGPSSSGNSSTPVYATSPAAEWEPTEGFVKEQSQQRFGWCTPWQTNTVRELLLVGAHNQREYQSVRRIAIIDARIAELRENDNAPRPATAADWEPTREQILAVAAPLWQGKSRNGIVEVDVSVRAGLIAGYRIAKEESCSQVGSSDTSSADSSSEGSSVNSTSRQNCYSPSSPVGLSSSSSDSLAESPTESSGSSKNSLDSRCEALFVKNPEWRPQWGMKCEYGGVASKMGFVDGKWRLLASKPWNGEIEESQGRTHSLAALLPRAIEKFEKNLMVYINFSDDPRSKSPLSWKIAIPRTLSEAVEILEAP